MENYDEEITVDIALSKKDTTSMTWANLVDIIIACNSSHLAYVLIEQNCRGPAIWETNRAFLLAAFQNVLYVNLNR